MSTPNASLWSVISFPTKMNQESSEKRLIPGLRQGRYKMNPEHFVILESKKLLNVVKLRFH